MVLCLLWEFTTSIETLADINDFFLLKIYKNGMKKMKEQKKK